MGEGGEGAAAADAAVAPNGGDPAAPAGAAPAATTGDAVWAGGETTRLPSSTAEEGPTEGVRTEESTPAENARRRSSRDTKGSIDVDTEVVTAARRALVLPGDPSQMLGVGLDPRNVVTRVNSGSQFVAALKLVDGAPRSLVGWRVTKVGHLDVDTLAELKAELANLRQFSVPRCEFHFAAEAERFEAVWSAAADADGAAADAGNQRPRRPSTADAERAEPRGGERGAPADPLGAAARASRGSRHSRGDCSPLSDSGILEVAAGRVAPVVPDACLHGHLRRSHRRGEIAAQLESPEVSLSARAPPDEASPPATKPRRATLATAEDAARVTADKPRPAPDPEVAGWREQGTADPCAMPPDTVVTIHRRQTSTCALR